MAKHLWEPCFREGQRPCAWCRWDVTGQDADALVTAGAAVGTAEVRCIINTERQRNSVVRMHSQHPAPKDHCCVPLAAPPHQLFLMIQWSLPCQPTRSMAWLVELLPSWLQPALL